MYKYIIPLLLLTASMLIAQPAPTRDSNGDATFTDEGIWHKNMELICPVPVETDSAGQWNEMMELTKINSNLGKQLFYIGGLNFIDKDKIVDDYSYIRVDNLTNPRKPEFNFRRIYVKNGEDPVRLGRCAAWTSDSMVYAICSVENNNNIPQTTKKFKALIFNLTKLIESGEKEIIVTNIKDRSKTFDNITDKNVFSNIYLGYIESIEEYFQIARCELGFTESYVGPHTMTIDKKSSVLTFSHNIVSYYERIDTTYENNEIDTIITHKYTDGFVDVVVLDGIPGNDDNYYGIENHPDYSSSTVPISVSRLLKDEKPIRCNHSETMGPKRILSLIVSFHFLNLIFILLIVLLSVNSTSLSL